jgi:hypothetical protein
MAAMRQQAISTDLLAPVLVRCSCGWLACFTESLSDTWVRIQSLEGLPALGEKCKMVFELVDGKVEARGSVLQINGNLRQYTMELTHLDTNGELLLDHLINPANSVKPEETADETSSSPSLKAKE